jgi:hypothetical protein
VEESVWDMGLNVDLCQMLGVPDTMVCPNCGKEIASNFDDYDIEGLDVNVGPGRWRLLCYCEHCEHEWKSDVTVCVCSQENI